jgi:predicted AAA+ superfamily ATPase
MQGFYARVGDMDRTFLVSLLSRARGLALMRGVLGLPAVREMLSLMELLTDERVPGEKVADALGRLWGSLAEEPDRLLEDAWRSCVVKGVLEDENSFSLAAERRVLAPALVEQARTELRYLQELYGLDVGTLIRAVEEAAPEFAGFWTVPRFEPRPDVTPRREMTRMLERAEDWGTCASALGEYFARHGAGPFGQHASFRWRHGRLLPVERPDPVYLDDLVGYERERGPLLRNTERFLGGLPSHHALLYGPPGTGKSSTVKAVLNRYADRGLRLVQLEKEELEELPDVIRALEGRGPRFVIFVDDLSFEEHEVEYKRLKALLEGGVEAPPENVRVYATSNRRNLIRERFSDREDEAGTIGASDDVHVRDTMQEKLSLSARFGLRLTFPAPDQRRYLEIVEGLARGRGIRLPEEEVRERALLWDRWHAGRSGRTARQFVDELEGELASLREA